MVRAPERLLFAAASLGFEIAEGAIWREWFLNITGAN